MDVVLHSHAAVLYVKNVPPDRCWAWTIGTQYVVVLGGFATHLKPHVPVTGIVVSAADKKRTAAVLHNVFLSGGRKLPLDPLFRVLGCFIGRSVTFNAAWLGTTSHSTDRPRACSRISRYGAYSTANGEAIVILPPSRARSCLQPRTICPSYANPRHC